MANNIQTQKKSVLAVLPARYDSSRFPGKPLALIAGKPMIQHTYEQVKKSKLVDQVVVATDDQRIIDAVEAVGGRAIMTSRDHICGTDRVAETARILGNNFDIVVNVQGDEPLVDPNQIDAAISLLFEKTDAVVGTLVTPLPNESEVMNRNRVKTVLDVNGHILYFSRSMIPHNKSGKYNPKVNYYRHIGLFAFKADFLQSFAVQQPTPLQLEEDIELIKALEYGYKIKATIVYDDPHPGVDAPEDIIYIENFLKQKKQE
eukprot:TRINITY_DN2223_c1_g1_i1.p1 TRINITY_DN2223_c1_g1~~TRINITY_DN2223_c1_g1_i1.p1  ORF type:complete len:260 (-),score=135.80 TRINITY_DN2223_c1_g1_i1:78-857(-)